MNDHILSGAEGCSCLREFLAAEDKEQIEAMLEAEDALMSECELMYEGE